MGSVGWCQRERRAGKSREYQYVIEPLKLVVGSYKAFPSTPDKIRSQPVICKLLDQGNHEGVTNNMVRIEIKS